MLGPTLEKLQPTAEGLAPALQAFQSFAKETKPVIEDQIGPFTEIAQPPAAALRPAAADFAATQPQLTQSFDVLNHLFNGLAYNPPGKQEGYLYWLAWANHMAASLLASQDGMGPTRRGVVFGSCDSLRVYEAVGKANAILGTLVTLLNPPTFASVCGTGKAAAAGKANASAVLRQGAAQGDPLHAATLKALGETPPPVMRTQSATSGTTTTASGR